MRHDKLISKRRGRGVGLVEVLVTMLVVTVGLLGVAGTQMLALNNSYAAFQRNLAGMQVQDAIERLWASLCALNHTDSAIRDGALTAVSTEWNAAQAGSGSSRVEMTNRQGTITWLTTNSSPSFQITVSWTNSRINKSSAPNSDQQSVLQITQLPAVTCK